MRTYNVSAKHALAVSFCMAVGIIISTIPHWRPAIAAEETLPVAPAVRTVFEAERIFLSCTIFQDRVTGEQSLVVENNTGRRLPKNQPIYYQQTFDRTGEKTLIRFDKPLGLGREASRPIAANTLQAGNCNAWAMVSTSPPVAVDIEALTLQRQQ